MRQGLPSIYGSIGLSCLVILFLGSSTETSAQRKRPTPRRANPTTTSKTAKPAPTREPELQLERLPADPDVENADFSITAHVKARSLKFDAVPNVRVEFFGHPERTTIWDAQRENLPTPVQPGVTYRNIGIRLKITSVFRDIDRIVAEALGEIPISDDKPATGKIITPAETPTADSPAPNAASSRPPGKR